MSDRWWLPWAVAVAAALFSLWLLREVKDEVFYVGDGGIKALQARQFSAGRAIVHLELPAPAWAEDLWRRGFYPLQEPFVYRRGQRWYATFPFTFPLVTAPFHRLLGFRGLYLVPLLALWAVWVIFVIAAGRAGIGPVVTAAGLAALAFASFLTPYGALYWEHTLAVALSFGGLTTLLLPGVGGLTRASAAGAGALMGLAVWFREELACLAAVALVIAFASRADASLRRHRWAFAVGLVTLLGLLGVVNAVVYDHPLGFHAQERLRELTPASRMPYTDKLWRLAAELVRFFPLGLFPFAWAFSRSRWHDQGRWWLLVAGSLVTIPLLLPSLGGRQLGPRFLLILVPLLALLAAHALSDAVRARTLAVRAVAVAVFVAAFVIGAWRNSYEAALSLARNYRHRVASLALLHGSVAPIVAVSHQYVAAQLEAAMGEKVFFLTPGGTALRRLGEAMARQGEDRLLFLCYPAYSCGQAFADLPAQVTLDLAEGNGTLTFHRRGEFGRYVAYDGWVEGAGGMGQP